MADAAGIDYLLLDYGADPSGNHDSASAFIAAANEASRLGIELLIPVGTFVLDPPGSGGAAYTHAAGNPLKIKGVNRWSSSVILANPSMDLLALNVDGDSVENVTLDTKTHNCQAALVVVADHTRLRHAQIVGGSNIFAVFYAGPSTASQANPIYNIDNRVDDLILEDSYHGDGFSWSFQQHSKVSGIRHTGSRIAIYVCDDAVIDDYVYTPGGTGADNGFYVTPPSQDIEIIRFRSTAGARGQFGGSSTYRSTRCTVSGFRSENTPGGATMLIGDADLTMIDPEFDGNDNVALEPSGTATVDVFGGSIPQLTQQGPVSGAATVRLNQVTLPSFTPAAEQNANTFANFNGAGFDVAVTGGAWSGAGWAYNCTPIARAVAGYNPRGASVTQPAVPASGTAVTNTTGVDCTVYIAGGTVTAIDIEGTPTGATGGPVRIAAGQTITLTYSSVPTWTWFGD